jgi:hypothetical protein
VTGETEEAAITMFLRRKEKHKKYKTLFRGRQLLKDFRFSRNLGTQTPPREVQGLSANRK